MNRVYFGLVYGHDAMKLYDHFKVMPTPRLFYIRTTGPHGDEQGIYNLPCWLLDTIIDEILIERG